MLLRRTGLLLLAAVVVSIGTSTVLGETYSSESTYSATSATSPTTPALTGVEVVNIHAYDAEVRWNTDLRATSKVMFVESIAGATYRTSDDRCDGGGYVSSHCVRLTNLKPGVQYHAKPLSASETGLNGYGNEVFFTTLNVTTNTSLSSTDTGTSISSGGGSGTTSGTNETAQVIPPTDTTAPVISEVHADGITSTYARIRWNTDELSDSRVAYGASYGYFLFSSQRCDGGGLVREHCVYVNGLEPNTKYYYKVESRNAVLLDAESLGHTFTTGTTATQTGTVSTAPVTLNPDLTTTQTIIQPYDSATRDLETIVSPAQPVETTPTATTQDLEVVNTALRTIQQETKTIETSVEQTITRDLQPAIIQIPEDSETREQLEGQTYQLAEAVGTVVRASGQVSEADLQSGLSSSLNQIQQLIRNETGVSVDLSPTARKVAEFVQERAPDIAAAREELLRRDGLDLYEDTDLDGVSNYDESRIYHTNPLNAYTGGSALTDGERILLGLDVHSSSTERVAVESPKVAGVTSDNLYELYSIEVQKVPVASATAGKDTGTASSAKVGEVAELPKFEEKITFSGRALPNSFVTIYIFSTPIVVTVKTDLSGSWKYTLDSELEDGSHEMYVATVDAGGKILAKSPAIPFIKTAEAAEYTPLLIGQTTTDPLDVLRDNMFIVAIAGFLIAGVAALMILGGRREQAKEVEKYEVPSA